MRWLLIAVVCGWMQSAWADYQNTPGTRFDLSELTSEFKATVPTLEGCDDTGGVVTCRRLSGDFSAAEKASLDAALSAHDPDIRAKRKAQRQQRKQEGRSKLKAIGLTEEELKALLDE